MTSISRVPPAARSSATAGMNRYRPDGLASSVSYTHPVAGSTATASGENRPIFLIGAGFPLPALGTSRM
jgi:hypothetical protein